MKPFFEWRGAVLKSDLPSTTRFVLLTLGCHMNDQGESCWPSIETLSSESGLGRSTVIQHLGIAKDLGWILCEKHGYANSKWARNDYKISYPESILVVQQLDLGSKMVVQLTEKNTEMVVQQLDTNSTVILNSTVKHSAPSKSSATNPPPENKMFFDIEAGQFRDIPEDKFLEWEAMFKKIDVVAEIERAEGWLKVNPRKHKKNYDRFLFNWFSRALDRLGDRPTAFKPQPAAA